MEGRTIVRPGIIANLTGDRKLAASMEGRTIVRPGPQNAHPADNAAEMLQWRAGQLSGQA